MPTGQIVEWMLWCNQPLDWISGLLHKVKPIPETVIGTHKLLARHVKDPRRKPVTSILLNRHSITPTPDDYPSTPRLAHFS